jgi:hypothetical protein
VSHFAGRLVAVLASQRTACALLALLALLTYLGTLAQTEHGLYEVQRRYFASLLLWQPALGLEWPLPGGVLLLSLLSVNLGLGGLWRLRHRPRPLGVLVTHLGVAALLLSALVEHRHREEGHVTLFPGQSTSAFQSDREVELAVQRALPEGRTEEHLLPESTLRAVASGGPRRFAAPTLPFAVTVEEFHRHARPEVRRDGRGLATVELVPLPVPRDAEEEAPGARVRVEWPGAEPREGWLWARDQAPWTVECGGERYALDLRRRRTPLPFRLTLERFTKLDHPGLALPRHFSSDLRLATANGERPVTIAMNEPLREGGLVLYQASFGPATARPGEPLFSTLAVVRNPADRWPLWGCVAVALGLASHFAARLRRHLRAEGAGR